MSVESEIENEPDPAVAGPGATLKAQREAGGHSIEQVSTDTRITRSRLMALEADEYDRVGAHTFVVGYIRKYAKWLGSDADDLVRAFEARVGQTVYTDTGQQTVNGADPSGAPREEESRDARPSPAKRLPLLWIVVGLLVVWVLAALWFSGSKSDEQAKPVDAVQQQKLGETESQQPASELSDGTLNETLNETEEATPEPADDSGSTDDVQESALPEPLETGQPTEAISPQPANRPSNASAQVQPETPPDEIEEPVTEPVAVDTMTMTFSDDCWVEVSDATGNELFAQLQQAGDNLHLSGQAPFKIMLGNARAVTLLVNGQLQSTDPGPNRDTLRLNVGP